MKYIPMLFSTPMIQAILEGSKTQTRRIVKGRLLQLLNDGLILETISGKNNSSWETPYKEGDVVWVRESWHTSYNNKADKWEPVYKADGVYYYDDDGPIRWKPSMHMPKNVCRLFLKVKSVRVERLQDIFHYDVLEEGIKEFTKDGVISKFGLKDWAWSDMPKDRKDAFKMLWQSINGKESWNENPWVFAITFERIERPVDFIMSTTN